MYWGIITIENSTIIKTVIITILIVVIVIYCNHSREHS